MPGDPRDGRWGRCPRVGSAAGAGRDGFPGASCRAGDSPDGDRPRLRGPGLRSRGCRAGLGTRLGRPVRGAFRQPCRGTFRRPRSGFRLPDIGGAVFVGWSVRARLRPRAWPSFRRRAGRGDGAGLGPGSRPRLSPGRGPCGRQGRRRDRGWPVRDGRPGVGHHPGALEVRRSRGRGDGGPSEVHVRAQIGCGLGNLDVLNLGLGRRKARPAQYLELLRSGLGANARAAIVADAVDRDVVDHRLVVHIGNMDVGDVVDRPVVIELVSLPAAALVAVTGIAIAVVDAAVEPDVRSPVAAMEAIPARGEHPVAGGPEEADAGRRDPGAGHPVIAPAAPGPVAGGPDIAIGRDRRL